MSRASSQARAFFDRAAIGDAVEFHVKLARKMTRHSTRLRSCQSPPAFTVRRADWRADEAAIAHVRRAVFIDEQAVPEALEWEAQDPECAWFVACSKAGEIVGSARLTPDARIGRMAVLAPWRRRGVGAALLAATLTEASRQGFSRVRLSAQSMPSRSMRATAFSPRARAIRTRAFPTSP